MIVGKLCVGLTNAQYVMTAPITAGLTGAKLEIRYIHPRWQELGRLVTFQGGKVSRSLWEEGGTVTIPWEVLQKPGTNLTVGITGTDGENSIVIPTVPIALCRISPGTEPGAEAGTDPSLPVWAQLETRVRKIEADGVIDPDQLAAAVNRGLEEARKRGELTGSVSSVAGMAPDEGGNVPLTAEYLGALPASGGTMTGPVNMNAQELRGLKDPTKEDHAANLKQVKNAAPRNLLDNSDFRSPVNQRGKDAYPGTGYGIDRWRMTVPQWMVSLADGCIQVSDNPNDSGTKVGMLRQDLAIDPGLRGKTVTFAAKLKGNGMCRLNINNHSASIGDYTVKSSDGVEYGDEEWHIRTVTGTVPENAETFFVALQSRNMETYFCQWVALYEGTYSADTLPEYRPKGHAAELMECRRYYVNFGDMTFRSCLSEDGVHNLNIPFPVPMRVIPTIDATLREPEGGEIPGANVSKQGIGYSGLTGKFTLRGVTASADL